jgi:dTDP-3,4-didehydro-2,6-dideoxy-alpha-D-glucose 3-reductase
MKKLIKIGILGCANIAKRYVIPSIMELSDYFTIIGIASRTKEKAYHFSNKFNIDTFVGYETLLENKNIDAVYIPLPNALHAEWIEKAFDKNLHVLVEKSLATTFHDVKRLNEIALEKNLVLVENFQFRFHKQLSAIKNFLKKGVIGELRSVRSSFGFPPFPDEDNIRYKIELGGGALLDAGAYPVKISQIFLGNDIEAGSSNLWFDSNKGVDIWGGAYLTQKNGNLFSEIAFGFDNHYQCNLELWGSKGKITANRIFTCPPGAEAEIILETSGSEKIIKVKPDNHFTNMLLHFYKLIQTKNGVETEYTQNINQGRLLKEIRDFKNK